MKLFCSGLLGWCTLVLLLSQLLRCTATAPSYLRSYALAEEDTIRVEVGEYFEVKLPSFIGAGYLWKLPDPGSALLILDSTFRRGEALTPFEPAPAPKEVFVFTARQTGTEHLKMYLARPWEVVPTDSAEWTVIVAER